jgi:hypothetical protein
MSVSTILTGTPAGLKIDDITADNIDCTTLVADSAVNAPVFQNAGVAPTVTSVGSTVAGSSVNITSPLLNCDGTVSANVLGADTATIGVNGGTTTPLLVVGPGAPSPAGSVVFDKIMNPAVVQFYQPPTAIFPLTLPSNGDVPVTLLAVAVPPSAQNCKYLTLDFLFEGIQSNGSATVQEWTIYLSETAGAAQDPAKAGELTINYDGGAAPWTWTGTTSLASTGSAEMRGGRFQVWYKPTAALPATIYLTIDGLATAAGGTLNAGFALDGIVVAYN